MSCPIVNTNGRSQTQVVTYRVEGGISEKLDHQTQDSARQERVHLSALLCAISDFFKKDAHERFTLWSRKAFIGNQGDGAYYPLCIFMLPYARRVLQQSNGPFDSVVCCLG